MDNSRLAAKALATLVSGTRSEGRQRKRWTDKSQRGSVSKRKRHSTCSRRCKRQKEIEKYVHVVPSSAT